MLCFKLFSVIDNGGTSTSSFAKPQKGKSRGGSDLEIAEAIKWTSLGGSIAQATAYSGMLSLRYGRVLALRYVEKQLVYLDEQLALSCDYAKRTDN
jgi:hypothetical protein